MQVVDAHPVGLPQIGHQNIHARLGIRREVLLDVQPAHRVAEQALDEGDAALPALADLLGAAERAAVEREILLDHLRRQGRGAAVDEPPPGPVLPVGEVRRRPECSERGQIIRLAHNDFRNATRRRSQCRDPPAPVETGSGIRQFGEGAQVVGQVGVAAAHHIPVGCGQSGLQRDDPAGPACVFVGGAPEDQGEHRRDVGRVGAQDRGVLIVAVIGLVGKAQAGLADMDEVAGRILGVGVDVDAHPAAHSAALEPADDGGQRSRALGDVDGPQFVEQRSQSPILHSLLVDETGVQIADPLFVGALPAGCGTHAASKPGPGDDLVHLFLGAVVQFPERAVGGPVGRHRVFGQPAAVEMAE